MRFMKGLCEVELFLGCVKLFLSVLCVADVVFLQKCVFPKWDLTL